MLLTTQTEKTLLEHLLDKNRVAIARLDSSGRYTRVNKSYASLFGDTQDNLTNHSWTETLDKADRDHANAALKIATKNSTANFEAKIKSSGKLHNIEMTVLKIPVENYTEFYVLASKQVEEDKPQVAETYSGAFHTQSFSLLDDLFNTSEIGILMRDIEHRIVWINPTFTKFFGLSKNDVLGFRGESLPVRKIKWFLTDFNGNTREIPAPRATQEYFDDIECHVSSLVKREQRWLEYRCTPVLSGLYKGGHVEYFYDITKRKKNENAINNSRERAQNLATRLQTIREDERKNIAQELHDELGQSLTAVKMELSSLRNTLLLNQTNVLPELVSERLEVIIKIAEKNLDEVRRILFRIRPAILEEVGLATAVSILLDEFNERTKITIFRNINISDISENYARDLVIFRILQETLTNITRHARARNVTVSIYKIELNSLVLEVSDDGVGISQERISSTGSLGLTGMRERARALGGRFEIVKLSNSGTKVRLTLPL